MMWFPRKMQKYYSRFAQRKFSIFLFGVITLVLSIILLISSFKYKLRLLTKIKRHKICRFIFIYKRFYLKSKLLSSLYKPK